MNKYETKTLKRISKRAARRAYNAGKNIIITAHKIRPDNIFSISANINNSSGILFDTLINAYEFYNCNYECGYYAAFYIRRDA